MSIMQLKQYKKDKAFLKKKKREAKGQKPYKARTKVKKGSDVEIDFSRINEAINKVYYPCLGYNRRYEIYMGGAGSGKSVFVTQKLCILMMVQEGHKVLALRKIGGTCNESIFAEFKATVERFGVTDLWKFRNSQSTMDAEYIPNGSRIIFKGFDEPEKIKSISGLTCIWLEEATEFTPADINQLDLRLRPPKPFMAQIFVSFNPINVTHWLNGRFFKGGQKGKTNITITTYKDNEFLEQEYLDIISAFNDPESPTYDPYYYQVYGKGEWGIIGDLVYTHIKVKDNWPWECLFDRTPYDNAPEFSAVPFCPHDRFFGLDFGFNAPTALVEFLVWGDEIYMRQHVYKKKQTTSGLIDWLVENNIPRDVPIYADSADPGRIEEIHAAGFLIVPADKEHGSVEAGIQVVKSLAIWSHEDNIDVNNELASYAWETDKNGDTIDTPGKKNDHSMDAMRYAIYTHLRGRVAETDDIDIDEFEDYADPSLNLEQDLLY